MAQYSFAARTLSGPALLLVIGAMFCSSVPKAAAADDSLQSRYQGKQVILRDFYCGSELKFDMEGKQVRGRPSGAWTLCRDIRIEKIWIKDGNLEIEGQRVFLFYDSNQQQFRNVLEIMDKKQAKGLANRQRVAIEALLPPNPDDQIVSTMLDKLFYSSEEEFAKAVPDFWKPFFRRLIGPNAASKPASGSAAPPGEETQRTASTGQNSQEAADNGGNEVFHIGGAVKPPVAFHQPDPDYAEEARQASFQGSLAMTVVIGPDGKVYRPRVSKPLGMGLDEKARDKVLTWKFKPATKDGQPVAVEVSVEVQFNLY
jgi:TonB family protein